MIDQLPLGRQIEYTFRYNPGLLCPIPRQTGREAAGTSHYADRWLGEDIWNIYELSWLSPAGKPEVAIAELRVPASSPNLIESKSLKLYCNSFNMSRFNSTETVRSTMERDLSNAAGAEVAITFTPPAEFGRLHLIEPEGTCLDDLALNDITYRPDPCILTTAPEKTRETLFSRLFRSCCPVTGQPDWATITIDYGGDRIIGASLLRYLISYREHAGFHEACVEKIFSDIMARCQPEELTVLARFTRRGGIDINPVRSTVAGRWPNLRDPRQ